MSDELHRIPHELHALVHELEGKTHLLASHGDPALANSALRAAKALFELGVSHESFSHPHIHPFLASVTEPQPIVLRSSTKSSTAKAPSPPPPESLLPYTPLADLVIDSMGPEQVWAQLELKNEGVCRVTASVAEPDEQLGMGMEDENGEVVDSFGEESDEDEEEDEEGEDSMDEMSEEEFRRMMLKAGGDVDLSDEDDEESGTDGEEAATDSEDEEEDGDEENDDEEEEVAEEYASLSLGEDDDEEAVSAEDDDESASLEDEEAEEDDGDIEGEGDSDEEMEDEDAEEASGEGEDGSDALLSQPSSSRIRPKHPTLDDEFFSIDDFNRITEEAEAGRITSGRLGGEEDDEEELDDMDTMMLREADGDEPLMYSDFFEAPKPVAKSRGKQVNGATSKGRKGKQKAVSFDEDEEDEEDGDAERGQAIMGTLRTDLFDDEDDEEGEEQTLSTHEKRQLALAKQIAELEQEAIGPKEWTLLGEATAKARPENSLLEENLDFEQISKVVPVITEDTVKTLEDMIKARILDNNFDSVVRVRAYDPTPFLPSRYFDLQDTQSTKSLAQIYEDEYTAAASGSQTTDVRDLKLNKEHEEIDRLWGEICYKLDALSSLNFVPKQPKAQIQTVENLPTTSMETALPPTSAASAMLAPEEQFAPPKQGELRARTEMTPEEKQRARQRKKQAKKGEAKRLEEMAQLYGRAGKNKTKGSKGEKEDALRSLVKQGKGVTVVGKGGREADKAKRRVEGDAAEQNSKRLKL